MSINMNARARATLLAAAGGALLVSACAMEPELAPDVESFDGRELIGEPVEVPFSRVVSRTQLRADERQLTVAELDSVDNGDGTWSYAAPADFDRNTAVTGKLATWRYVAQARFSNAPKPATSTRYHVVKHDAQKSPRQQLASMRRVDSLGRIWRMTAVDSVRWQELSQPHPSELEVASRESSVNPAQLEPELPEGTIVPWKPMSWDHSDCDPLEAGKELHLWDGESRVAKTSDYTDRQKSAVSITNNTSNTTCSGVILRENQILTAAHCVSDDDDNHVLPSTISVCRLDAAKCFVAENISFPTAYHGGSGDGGGTDFADDWAIIELAGTWLEPVKDMDLSSASDATIGDLSSVRNLSYPGFDGSCNGTNAVTLFVNDEQESVAKILKKKLRFKIDGAPGQSGSPFYYCPDGDPDKCVGSQKGFVYGVFSGWNSVRKRYIGPKAPYFKDAAIVFMDD